MCVCFRQAGINREILNKMWRNTYTNHRRELAWQRICLLFHCLLLLLLCEFSLFESRFLDTFGSVVVDWVIFSSLLGVLKFFPFFFFFGFLFAGNFVKIIFAWLFKNCLSLYFQGPGCACFVSRRLQ